MAHPVSLGPVSRTALLSCLGQNSSDGKRNPPSQSGESFGEAWRPSASPTNFARDGAPIKREDRDYNK